MSRTRRLLLVPVTMLVVALLTFCLLELVPGDPAATRLGATSSEAARAALRAALGLQGGALARLLRYLSHLARFDLGRSLVDGRAVRDKIFERLPITFALALVSSALAWTIALPLALRRAGRGAAGRFEFVDLLFGLIYAVPVPALAIALLALGAPYGASTSTVAVAALCLSPLLVPRVYSQALRALDEALRSDEARTLRSVGASPRRVARAALRSAALRLVTLASLQLPALLSGAVLVEAIFGLPGLGLLAFDALAGRDQPVLLGLVIVGAALSIGTAALVDLAAPLLDPRLRPERT